MHGYCNECHKELISPSEFKMYRQKKLCLKCYELKTSLNRQSDEKRKKLEKYICKLFKFDELPIGYSQQIDKFIKEYKFTATGIEASLYYFYELLENDISKDVYLGIVPKIYNEAKNYFKELKKIEEINANFEPKKEVERVRIQKPNGLIPTKSSTEGWE